MAMLVPDNTKYRAETVTRFDPASGALDAFGRLRVASPYTIFDSKQVFDDSGLAQIVENFPQYFDNQETSGAGTSTLFSPNRASTTLSVSDLTAGTRVRQSKRRINYQPGKGQRAFLTGVIGAGGTGITQRYGLFDENNGLFFEVQEGRLRVVRRTNITGTPVDNVVDQSDWNVDPMNGRGPSNITIDPDTDQIFYIDFEWLGVGTVRFGIVVDGVILYVHQMDHANSLAGVYMSTPNLPVRAEISNDGTGGPASLEMICSSVDSEGGVDPNGINRTKNSGSVARTLAAIGTKYAMVGIRLRSTHLGLQVDPTSIDIVSTSVNDTLLWELQLNPTVTGTFTYSDIFLSGCQGAAAGATPPTVTVSGEVLASGYVQSRTSVALPANLNQKLGSLINGTADRLVLVCTPISTNTDTLAAMNWRELL